LRDVALAFAYCVTMLSYMRVHLKHLSASRMRYPKCNQDKNAVWLLRIMRISETMMSLRFLSDKKSSGT